MKITVKEAVRAAARALGIEDGVEAYLQGNETNLGERDTNILVESFNRVENDLALEYLALTIEEPISTVSGVIPYSLFTSPFIRILDVKDANGNSVKYKLFPDRLETQAGKVTVFYVFAPTEKTLEDEGEYEKSIVSRVFLYGMASEYCLMAGEMENADAWNSKYQETLRLIYQKRTSKRMQARRWV